MVHWKLFLLVLIFALAPARAAAQKISKETIISDGKKRTFYLYVPKSVTPATPVPLLVLLHGSNHIGLSLAEKWNDLAEKEGVIIVAPDSADSSVWSVPNDGPVFIHELVESIKGRYPINAKRVYLFGHSGGAVFALLMSLYESEYFAAAAIHAGALPPEANSLVDEAKRKTPIHIQIGTVDESFPLKSVKETRDLLTTHGFPVELVEMRGHNHWYYDLAPRINQAAWEFLKAQELPGEPRFVEYQFKSEAREPDKAAELFSKARDHEKAGDMVAAIAAYTRDIELDRNYADAYNNRAVVYLVQKDYPAALADLNRSIELAPSDAAYYNRAGILFSQQKIDEAIADYTAGIHLKPSADGYANRGVAYEHTKRDELARADYDRAIELNPKFARAYLLRGLLLLKAGQDAAAQKDLDKGFQLDASLHGEFDPLIKQFRPNQ
ncbi:MAG: polyhydroxybutyrate depolymerase [Blastocatellia bacterium]|jgi:tetratricopeptide (TPR) repeat protein|nr:polyhydroxybutyrate depolymerase [Blastocatellia bacterium]